MGKIIVYYDDNEASCEKYIRCFNEYENVECKHASDYSHANSIELENNSVGFVFSGTKEKIPKEIRHIISVLNVNAPKKCFILVTGGRRELGALKEALHQLDDKGYHVMYMFSPFFYNDRSLKPYKIVKRAIEYVDNASIGMAADELSEIWEKSVKESKMVRSRIRKDIFKYFKYLWKKKRNKEI